MRSGIYLITNTVTDKKYVGQSYDVERRIRTHKNKLREGTHNNSHLQSAWNLYGEYAFSFTVVEYCPISDLNDKEVFWIKHFNTFSPKGYNMTLGGDGNRGYLWSDDAKRRLSESAKQRTSHYWQGKHLTEAHKEKLREAAQNRSEEHKRKIGEASRRVMSDPTIKQKMILHQNNRAVYCSELDKTFYSIAEAARQTGLSGGNISKVCRGVIKKTGGYHFNFADVPRDTP